MTIRAGQCGDRLNLTVSDDGPGFAGNPQSQIRQGFGLANIRERLELMYGRDGSLILENEDGAKATISIPRRVSPKAE